MATVHYGVDYDNAFWDGSQMVYGDGDQQLFKTFTGPLDVTGHELTHGVTQYSGGLDYKGQSGALNESMSDVFGSLVKQYHLGQTADQADWLIGQGMFTDAVHGVALRSMKAPGTAYDDPTLGKDPQPGQMADYVDDRQRQRRRARQLRHPQPRVLPGRDRDRRPRVGEGRAGLVRHAHQQRRAHWAPISRLFASMTSCDGGQAVRCEQHRERRRTRGLDGGRESKIR